MLATLTVNSLLDDVIPDDGLVTLREAIVAANADTETDLGQSGNGSDVIRFADTLSGDVALSMIADNTIGDSALAITSDVTIEGRIGASTIRRSASAANMRLFLVEDGGELTLRSLNVTGGVAEGAAGELGLGGAVFVSAGGRLNVVASTIYENVARGGTGANGLGGAVYIDGGSALFLNATVSGNSVQESSGEVSGFGANLYASEGSLSIYNSTIVSTVDVPGRNVYVFAEGAGASAELRADNSIFTFTGSLSGSDVIATADMDGVVTTAGNFNLVSSGPAGLIGATTAAPPLGDLADNGGPTLTHALIVGEEVHPALDQGDPDFDPNNPDGDLQTDDAIPYDQRGGPYARVLNGDGVLDARVDIGAFEFGAAPSGPELSGDYNGDHVVNAADYTVWRNTVGTSVSRWSGADGDGDETVGPGDYTVWKEHFGESISEAAGLETGGNASALAKVVVPVSSSEPARSPSTPIAFLSAAFTTGRADTSTGSWWPAGLSERVPTNQGQLTRLAARSGRASTDRRQDLQSSSDDHSDHGVHIGSPDLRGNHYELAARHPDGSHLVAPSGVGDAPAGDGCDVRLTPGEWDLVWSTLSTNALT